MGGSSEKRRRLLTYLPSLSGLAIAAVGAFYSAQAFLSGKAEIAGMLESLARALRS